MKKILVVGTLSLSSLLSTNLMAEEPKTELTHYVGAKFGTLDVDVEDFDPGSSQSIVYGAMGENLGIEIQATMAKVDFEDDFDGYTEEVNFRSLGVFGVARSATEGVYVKGILGISHVKVDNVEADQEASVGIGLGVASNVGLLELDVLKPDSDSTMTTLGFSFKF